MRLSNFSSFASISFFVFVLIVVVFVSIAPAGQAALWLQSGSTPVYLPFVAKNSGATEWSQHAHDAQRTSYTAQVVDPPWRLRWIWNGVNSSGDVAKVTSNGRLPRNVQPVTGGGRVYIAAGEDGVFALDEASGQQKWQRSGIGSINSTAAYDADTAAVFVISNDGKLYKLSASDGMIPPARFETGQTSDLPLPPAVLSDRVLFSMGNSVFAVDKHTMQQIWRYDAGSGQTVVVPPAYSPSRNLVIAATEPDLKVHAIDNTDGSHRWSVRPLDDNLSVNDPTEYRYGWPVIAESAGLALIKVRLDWQKLWREWPQTNSAMRQMLKDYPDNQALFVMKLDDGSIPFIANVGHGGYGDNNYLPMGPQPVVKRMDNGKEVVYTIIRAKRSNYDGRWDSHFGEMMLDNSTVSSLQDGDVRFIAFDWPPGDANSYLLTDEQPNVSMAGDYLFGGHWEAGFALKIGDRSDSRGTFTEKITSQRLDTIATSQDDTKACAFSPSHYCASGLRNTRPYDFGFYIYYDKGNVYDQYWSEYAVWVVSNDNLYFRSADGAIVALTHGNPQITGSSLAAISAAAAPTPQPVLQPEGIIPHTAARQYAGSQAVVSGRLAYVFNNRKQVMLGFSNPHMGSFKIIIRKADWGNFPQPPEQIYRIGQQVQVSGLIEWYQGDPAIYATSPAQIVIAEGQ